jgi:hypothetical protein
MQAQSFYSRVYDTAKSLGATDTQAHLAAAQASQETGYGQHVVGNNYFGIKAPTNAVDAINAQTQESINGQMVNTNASFRSFKSLEDAVAGYMATMATNFPDAWNAPTFSEAVQGLKNGILGRYATDPKYEAKVTKIASKYGDEAQANSVSQDPLQSALSQPYEANGLTNGVTALTSGIVAPEVVTSQTVAPTAVDPAFSPNGLLAGTPQTFAGLLSTPAQNNFGDLAAAGPISAPLGVTATGQMKATTQTPANASVGLLGVAPSAENWGGLSLDASAKAVPASFDASRFGDVQPSTDNFDSARFGDPAAQSFDTARFGTPDAVQQAMATPTAINPSVPTTNSFSDLAAAGPLSAPASVTAQGGLLSNPALSASASVPMSAGLFSPTVENTGLTSTGFQSVADQASQNLASMQAQPSYTAPAVSAQPTNSFGDLAAAGPVNTGLLSGYQPTAAVPAGVQAINAVAPVSSSLLSGAPLESVNAPLTSSLTSAGLLSQPSLDNLASQYKSFVPSDVAAPETATETAAVDVSQDPAVSMPSLPSLDTVSVPDQPTVAGPVNTPAVTQQAQQAVTNSAPNAVGISGNTKPGMLGGLTNKETAIGGLLGGLTAGPIGGLLGGLLGSQVAKAGGITGLLGGAPLNINNIGTGLANTSSVWGGAPAGTQATANNGSNVTSLGGGWTAVTNKYGVTTSFGPNNQVASYFGPSLSGAGRTPGTSGGGGSGGRI